MSRSERLNTCLSPAASRSAAVTLLACLSLLLAGTPLLGSDYIVGSGPGKLRDWMGGMSVEGDAELSRLFDRSYALIDADSLQATVDLLAGELPSLRHLIKADQLTELYLLLGQCYVYELERYRTAEPFLQQARERSTEEHSELWFEAISGLAASAFWKQEAERVLELAVPAHRRALEVASTKYQRVFAKWIGRSLEVQGKHVEALPYYQQVLELARQADDEHLLFDSYLSIAVTRYRMGDPTAGLQVLEEAAYLTKERRELQGLSDLWGGSMLTEQKAWDEASKRLTRAVATFDALKQRDRRVHARMELARNKMHAGEYRDVFPLVDSAMALAADHMTPYNESFAYSVLARAYEGVGDYARALQYTRQLMELNQHLDSVNSARNIEELTKRYELAEQARIIAAQRQSLKQSRWYLFALGVAALIILGLTVALVLQHSAKRKLPGLVR